MAAFRWRLGCSDQMRLVTLSLVQAQSVPGNRRQCQWCYYPGPVQVPAACAPPLKQMRVKSKAPAPPPLGYSGHVAAKAAVLALIGGSIARVGIAAGLHGTAVEAGGLAVSLGRPVGWAWAGRCRHNNKAAPGPDAWAAKRRA